jgi:hypothetical protein
MKKHISSAVVLATLFSAGTASGADRFIISAGVNYLQPADQGYREVYGDRAFYLDFQAGARLFKGLYALGGFGTLAKTGRTPELELEARSSQDFFTAGLGWLARVSGKLALLLEAGPAWIRYKEEAMGLTVSGSSLGFQAGTDLLLFGKTLFAGLGLGYMSASDTLEDVKIKLGGVRARLSLGVRL